MFRTEGIFLLISVSFVLTAGNDVKRKKTSKTLFLMDEGDRGAHSDRAGLWFGPRLGKRSLQYNNEDDNRDLYLRIMEAADAMKYYYNQLPVSLLERSEPDTRVTKKVIFTPKLGRSVGEEEHRYVEFTPRLGRRLTGEIAVTASDQDIYRGDDRVGKTRYYSPRLGRNMNFSPRLGRELAYENYPSIRVARSVNKTKNTQ